MLFNVWMNEEAIYEWKKSEWVQNTQVSLAGKEHNKQE